MKADMVTAYTVTALSVVAWLNLSETGAHGANHDSTACRPHAESIIVTAVGIIFLSETIIGLPLSPNFEFAVLQDRIMWCKL